MQAPDDDIDHPSHVLPSLHAIGKSVSYEDMKRWPIGSAQMLPGTSLVWGLALSIMRLTLGRPAASRALPGRQHVLPDVDPSEVPVLPAHQTIHDCKTLCTCRLAGFICTVAGKIDLANLIRW